VWRYEGSNTLAYYLRRRDTLRALARDLDVPEGIVVPVAMRQLLLGLAALHSAGLVHRCVRQGAGVVWSAGAGGSMGTPAHQHSVRSQQLRRCRCAARPADAPPHRAAPTRDVKPLNIIASERDGRLKLIDLGAAADLRTGTNYSPEESILDPMYCPPEQVRRWLSECVCACVCVCVRVEAGGYAAAALQRPGRLQWPTVRPAPPAAGAAAACAVHARNHRAVCAADGLAAPRQVCVCARAQPHAVGAAQARPL
jgi:hypothetical protein